MTSSSSSSSNDTVHISLGDTANHVTSHLLNLQGRAATASPRSSDAGRGGLCDPTVTHDACGGAADFHGRSGRAYVPRALIVDGRDAFGTPWDGTACATPHPLHPPQPQEPGDLRVPSWDGPVARFDVADHAILGEASRSRPHLRSLPEKGDDGDCGRDALERFRHAASVLGLSPVHSRFEAPAPGRSSHNAGGGAGDRRHVQWDDEEEEEDDDDGYGYGHHAEQVEEEKRRQLERTERNRRGEERALEASLGDAWEEAFYRRGSAPVAGGAPSAASRNSEGADCNANDTTATIAAGGCAAEREIHWHDYWMPPRPRPANYQVPLPFNTAETNAAAGNVAAWSTSFHMGYRPTHGGGGGDSAGITATWRENVLSESLRRVLERCDVVKGFSVFVDGGDHGPAAGNSKSHSRPERNAGTRNKHAQQLASAMATASGSGGFHAGLAASLLEELGEECRSAGRWAVLVDPPRHDDDAVGSGGNGDGKKNDNLPARRFRQGLNAGLALHGLSANTDALLPLSIDGAYRALRGDNVLLPSANRVLFEGSAALSLALEASTLCYRLRNRPLPNCTAPRSHLGVQSGLYHRQSGDEPYATPLALTHDEFLACARSSSDRRRSVLELDALLRPPLGQGVPTAPGGSAVPAAVLAQLAAAGLVGGGGGGGNTPGELQRRFMRGTSVERVDLERKRQRHRSSRGGNSAGQKEPGEWLEDISVRAPGGGGGLLSSLSGATVPFGKRAIHRHFSLSAALRPTMADALGSSAFVENHNAGSALPTSFLRPMMESMGVAYRPEASFGLVARESVAELTGGGSYWRTIFAAGAGDAAHAPTSSAGAAAITATSAGSGVHGLSSPPRDNLVTRTPVLSVLGNTTRSYPRFHAVSSEFADALCSRRNASYRSRDVVVGLVPEEDDCAEALEHCRDLVDAYEPPRGSGLLAGEGDDLDAYFDDEDEEA